MKVTHTLARPGDAYNWMPGDWVAWGTEHATFRGVVDSVDHAKNTVTLRDPTRWERMKMWLWRPIHCLRIWWRGVR